MKNRQVRSTVYLFLTAIIWGFAFVAQRVGADYVGAFTFNGIRFLLGALSLVPVVLLFERPGSPGEEGKSLKVTLLCALGAGIILFIASTLQQWGVMLTQSAGKAGFITGLYTVLVPVLGIFLGKKTGKFVWIGAILAVGGLFLLSVNDSFGIGLGEAVLLIGAFFWAGHVLFIDYFIARVSPLKFAQTQFAVCGVLSLSCALLLEAPTLAAIGSAALPILYGGIMSAGVAYTLQILGQRDADPTYASIIFSTESVFGAIGGALLLHEAMSVRAYIGCALIFGGILISQIKAKTMKDLPG